MTTYRYPGDYYSGFVFESSTLGANRSFNYNTSSISENNIEDYQSITSSFTSVDDYGQVNESTGSVTDYSLITETVVDTITPFGGLTLSGSSITQPNYRLFFSGASIEKVIYSPDSLGGTLFTFGEKVERRTYNYNESSSENTEEDYGLITSGILTSDDYGDLGSPGIIQDYGLTTEFTGGIITPFGGLTLSGSAITQPNYRLFFSGASIEKVIYSPDNTSGTLFGFGEKLESVTYDYNQESTYQNTDDYGLVSEITSGGADFGLISESSGSQPQENYGLITETIINGSITPFGSLSISGSAITAEINTYTKIGSGSVNLFGTVVERFAFDTPDNTQLFQIDGTSVNKESNNYVATGVLFSFGEKLERRSYAYNPSSVSDIAEDYQSISNFVIETEEFGFVSSIIDNGTDDYGRVGGLSGGSISPFGSIFISGSSTISFDRGPYSGNGSITLFGNVIEKESNSYSGSGAISISGTALDSSINVYVGIGTLLKFGEKVESVTYDYSENSIVTYDIIDYESIISSPDEYDNYGLIISPYDGIVDYGFIVGLGATETLYPFGSLIISGSVSDVKETDSYVGFGSIFISDRARIVQIDSYRGSGIISISGTAVEKDVDSYVGVGTLTISTSAFESEVEVYTGLGTLTLSGIATESISFNPPENNQLFTISGTVVEKDVDSYVGYGNIFITGTIVEKNTESYVGLGTLTLSGTALEAYSAQTPEDTQLFVVSGTALEAYSAQTPEDTQLFTISGFIVEKNTESYVGLGNLSLSGFIVEKNTESYVGLGTLTLSGTALEAYSAQTPEDTQLFQVSGTALEAYSAQTPEDTQLFIISGTLVEKNTESYVGLGTLSLSGSLVEKNTEAYVGLGTVSLSGTVDESKQRVAITSGSIFINGLGSESRTIFIPTPGIGTGFIGGNITISPGIALTHYYSPIYPRNSGVPGSGIGTIRINDDNKLTITRAVLPYFGRGGFIVSNTGDESFSRTNYDGSGLITLSGVSSTREIAVYTAVGVGTITLSDSFRVRDVKSYSTSGIIYLGKYEVTTQSLGDSSLTFDNDTVGFDDSSSQFVYSEAITTETDAYRGTGTIRGLSGVSESLIIQTTTSTQLFAISGSATDAYSAQTPETEVLYQLSGNITERRTYGYEGSGQATFGSGAIQRYEPRNIGVGLIRFATYLSDNLYDTCDSDDITSDHQVSAFVSFVSNPPENTVLYNFYGSASTEQIQIYTYSGFGSVGISGSHIFRKTNSNVGIGTLNITSTAVKKDIDSYVGSGSIAILSGSSESKVSIIPQSTILFRISGVSSSRTFNVYTYSGIGTAYFSGSALTRVLSTQSYSSVGTITLSGELIHPNVQFIPVAKGIGGINLSGSGLEKIGYEYLSVPQNLFILSGGFESFSESTYVGIGSIYIESIFGTTINNPYQEPRVYVTII